MFLPEDKYKLFKEKLEYHQQQRNQNILKVLQGEWPAIDEDGYPTIAVLELIKEWPFEVGYEYLVKLIQELWIYDDYIKLEERDDHFLLWLATGGWSGHEDIIEALQRNVIFWGLCWRKSEAGGKYEFEIPKTFLWYGVDDKTKKNKIVFVPKQTEIMVDMELLSLVYQLALGHIGDTDWFGLCSRRIMHLLNKYEFPIVEISNIPTRYKVYNEIEVGKGYAIVWENGEASTNVGKFIGYDGNNLIFERGAFPANKITNMFIIGEEV